MKCKYCEDRSVVIRDEEALCKRHYYSFYSEKLNITELEEVPKIKEEVILNKEYTKFMNTFDFYNDSINNQNKLKKTLRKFNIAVNLIKLKNPIYYMIFLLFFTIKMSGQITYEIYQDGVYKTSTTNTNYTVTGLQPATTYSFHIISVDAAGNKSPASNIITVTTLPKPVVYCSSYGKSTKECINKVQIGTINNYSGNNGGYGNFTTIKTDLLRNSTNTISISPYWSSSTLSETYRVWTDFNKDGDFLDNGEQLLNINKSKLTVVNGSIKIPSLAPIGETRMRISMKYNTFASSCETLFNGEVEDYTVNIK